MTKTVLSVRAVKQYKKPRYPGWQDPNPLDNPEAAPFPFSQKVWRFLTAAGLAGATFSTCTGESADNSRDPYQVQPDSLRNVFTFEKNGLPHQTPSFGTGAPANMDRRLALAVLENLAQAEGLHLEKGHYFKAEGINIQLDGWDTQRRTGFVLLDRDNLEDGYLYGYFPHTPVIVSQQDSTNRTYHLKYFNSWSEAWDFYNGHFPQHSLFRPHPDSLTEARALQKAWELLSEYPFMAESARRKLAFFKVMFPVEFVVYDYDEQKEVVTPKRVFPQLEQYLQYLAAGPDPEKQLAFYEDFEISRSIIQMTFRYKNAEKHWLSVFSSPDRAVRQQKIRQWSHLFLLCFQNTDFHDQFIKVLRESTNDPLDVFAADLLAFEHRAASMAELRQLDKLAASGTAFIMPVSTVDPRFQYGDWDILDKMNGRDQTIPPALFDSLYQRQQRQAALPDSLRNKPQTWKDKGVLDVLAELEQQARYYLRWAKSQGR